MRLSMHLVINVISPQADIPVPVVVVWRMSVWHIIIVIVDYYVISVGTNILHGCYTVIWEVLRLTRGPWDNLGMVSHSLPQQNVNYLPISLVEGWVKLWVATVFLSAPHCVNHVQDCAKMNLQLHFCHDADTCANCGSILQNCDAFCLLKLFDLV